MAKHIDDYIHLMASNFISRKYVARADARQKEMGLSYVEAEKDDLIREVAAFARLVLQRSEVAA